MPSKKKKYFFVFPDFSIPSELCGERRAAGAPLAELQPWLEIPSTIKLGSYRQKNHDCHRDASQTHQAGRFLGSAGGRNSVHVQGPKES